MIDAGADDVHVAQGDLLVALILRLASFVDQALDHIADLPVAAHHAVAQADRGHAAVSIGRPGEHRVGVAVVEQQHIGLGQLANVGTPVQHRCDAALAVHDAAGAEGVAHALVDAIPQRNIDIGLERLGAAHASGVDHVIGIGQGHPTIGRGGHPGRQLVCQNVPFQELRDHLEIPRVKIVQCELGISEFRNGQ